MVRARRRGRRMVSLAAIGPVHQGRVERLHDRSAGATPRRTAGPGADPSTRRRTRCPRRRIPFRRRRADARGIVTGNKGFVCMIAYTNYAFDARVRREAETLAAQGFRVRCLTTKNGGAPARFVMD